MRNSGKIFIVILFIAGSVSVLAGDRVEAHPAFISSSPDSAKTYICGREYASAGGCFTHWCMSYEMANGPKKPSEEQEKLLLNLGLEYSPWSPCYVRSGQSGGGDVDAGGVAWWGWDKGKLGGAFLDGFWVRDYRADTERKSCGMNCTEYGFAGRIAGNADCYHVREDWSTANKEDLLSSASHLPADGWLDMAYCMRQMVAD